MTSSLTLLENSYFLPSCTPPTATRIPDFASHRHYAVPAFWCAYGRRAQLWQTGRTVSGR
eukprot:6180370-Pleurochrysis_carterae.AAC.1